MKGFKQFLKKEASEHKIEIDRFMKAYESIKDVTFMDLRKIPKELSIHYCIYWFDSVCFYSGGDYSFEFIKKGGVYKFHLAIMRISPYARINVLGEISYPENS